MNEETLTLEEAADLLQMQPQVVARMKGLPAFRVGWQWRVRKRDLAKWMANHKLQRAVTS
jgi:excisionase family DNA binding protein